MLKSLLVINISLKNTVQQCLSISHYLIYMKICVLFFISINLYILCIHYLSFFLNLKKNIVRYNYILT